MDDGISNRQQQFLPWNAILGRGERWQKDVWSVPRLYRKERMDVAFKEKYLRDVESDCVAELCDPLVVKFCKLYHEEAYISKKHIIAQKQSFHEIRLQLLNIIISCPEV